MQAWLQILDNSTIMFRGMGGVSSKGMPSDRNFAILWDMEISALSEFSATIGSMENR
jgi:hypothetical protein